MTSTADSGMGLVTLPWCVRCGARVTGMTNARCPRAPDGGAHEPYHGPPFAVREGFSLHADSCPRNCPLPDFEPPCTCRRVASNVSDLIRPLLVQFYRCGRAHRDRGWNKCQTPDVCNETGCVKASSNGFGGT